MSQMHNPPHPGKVFNGVCLTDSNGTSIITVNDAAIAMNIDCIELSEFINGRRSVSPKLAEKIAKAFGGSSMHWLRMQASFDLWQKRILSVSDESKMLNKSTNV